MRADRAELVHVRILGLPVDLYARAREAHEGLMREFALISLSEEHAASVPARLVALTDELEARYAAFTASARAEQAKAVAQGAATVDVSYTVPADVGPAACVFDELLDEADKYCRQGDLLTLAPSEDVVAYRRWFLGEFIRQSRGEAPVPWSRYSPPPS